jgi:hypothetical protein
MSARLLFLIFTVILGLVASQKLLASIVEKSPQEEILPPRATKSLFDRIFFAKMDFVANVPKQAPKWVSCL